MNALRNQNLAEDMDENPEFAKKLAKFERLEIEGDKLILTPKVSAPQASQGDGNAEEKAEEKAEGSESPSALSN